MKIFSKWKNLAGEGMGEVGEGDQEYSYCDMHWVIYRSVESLYCTPEINITLHVN